MVGVSFNVDRNLIHGSDSVESAKAEISLWFSEKEVRVVGMYMEVVIYFRYLTMIMLLTSGSMKPSEIIIR